MCNITLIDTKDNIIIPKDVRTITTVNSLLGNFDGFGYYLFNTKEIVKTKHEASIYWRINYKNFAEKEFVNGIYHVRKSSTYSVANNPITGDDKSHPFKYNDIVVAHNGVLNIRYTHKNYNKFEKHLHGDLIDSQKFAIVLSKICEKGKVTFDNIKNALNLFGGAYALAIKGDNDDFAWLVRGKDRTLFSLKILDDETPVSIIINTSTPSPLLIGESLLDFGYSYKFEELKDNTAYKYNLNSYQLEEAGSILQDSAFETNNKPIVMGTPTGGLYPQGDWYRKENEETIYERLISQMYKMGLYFQDLVLISEIVYDKPIFLFEEEDFKSFETFLKKLSEDAHDSRLKLWDEIQKVKDGMSLNKLYSSMNIEYPFFLNTKDELKSLLHKLNEKGKEKHGLPLIQ